MSDLTSLQPLGETSVLVEYTRHTFNDKPQVAVSGAYVNGEFVRASSFSERQLSRWESDIVQGEFA